MNAVLFGVAFHQKSLSPGQRDFYLAVVFLVAGNLLFPALCHAVGIGPVLLPIYFFTLLAAYRYGLAVGLVTAILSPMLNTALTGMPPFAILDVLIVKSLLLALFAARMGTWSKVSFVHVFAVVFAYQAIGGLYEILRSSSLLTLPGDLVKGWPGLLLQWLGGTLVLLYWKGKSNPS